jgi:hypothetical protein
MLSLYKLFVEILVAYTNFFLLLELSIVFHSLTLGRETEAGFSLGR